MRKTHLNALIIAFMLPSTTLVTAYSDADENRSATPSVELISEEYLRSQFEFADSAKLKYSQCETKSYPTCTYIWGPESKKDAARATYGLPPQGNKLMVIYAQANSAKDFERVTGIYSDAENIKDIADKSVWSAKQQQLSFITSSHLVVHINLKDTNTSDTKRKAKSIAKYIMNKL